MFKYSSGRYHQNENSNKYAHIVPVSISDQLRKILGLSENDLPPYIYRLRKHGYPKAWLRHASIRPSGLNLYDAHGKGKIKKNCWQRLTNQESRFSIGSFRF